MLAIAGGFTADNYGDQLYPWVFERLLRQMDVDEEVRFLAPRPGVTRDGRPIGSLRSVAASRPRALVIGGGDIIRTDATTVAQDYLNIAFKNRRRKVYRVRAQVHARRHFSGGPGPWLVSDPRVLAQTPVGWASVGVKTLERTPALTRAIAGVQGAWVRTAPGVEAAVAAGMTPECCTMAPDAVFAIRNLVDLEAVKEQGRALLRQRTGFEAEQVAVVHAAPFTAWNGGILTSVFQGFSAVPVVFLSLGRYIGEHRELAAVADRLGRPLLEDLDAQQVTAVLAAAGSVTTTSMHAAIVASSLGRPVLVPGTNKTLDAFAACPDAPRLRLVDAETATTQISELTGSADVVPSGTNSEAVRRSFEWLLTRLGL